MTPAPLPAALAPTVPAPGRARLTRWGLIRASGEEARKFLHGQLTQDIEHLPVDQARLAGYCSAKGRLLATFVAWRHDAADGPPSVLLACSADLLPASLKRLSMFVLRAKCKLTDASADLPLWGLSGPWDGAPPLPVWGRATLGSGHLIRLPDALLGGRVIPRWLLAGHDAPALPDQDETVWEALELHSGVVRVVSATVEQFVPQMVNLELVGGVHFQKGCYPGQEVVARSQYRGTLKRRAYLLTGAEPLAAGQEIFHSDDPGQPAGLVALAAPQPAGQGHAALAELKIAATESGSLHAGRPDGPVLTLGALPYALPAAEAA